MPRHYTDEEKRLVLDRLIANHGDVDLTVSQTGVPERTIARWKQTAQRDGSLPPMSMPPPMPPTGTLNSPPSLAGEGPGVGVLSEEITERLTTLREEMLDAADTLSRSIISAIEEAPLNQRVAALAQLIDRIAKLAALLPKPEEEIEYVYEYEVEHHVEKKKDFEDEAED